MKIKPEGCSDDGADIWCLQRIQTRAHTPCYHTFTRRHSLACRHRVWICTSVLNVLQHAGREGGWQQRRRTFNPPVTTRLCCVCLFYCVCGVHKTGFHYSCEVRPLCGDLNVGGSGVWEGITSLRCRNKRVGSATWTVFTLSCWLEELQLLNHSLLIWQRMISVSSSARAQAEGETFLHRCSSTVNAFSCTSRVLIGRQLKGLKRPNFTLWAASVLMWNFCENTRYLI